MNKVTVNMCFEIFDDLIDEFNLLDIDDKARVIGTWHRFSGTVRGYPIVDVVERTYRIGEEMFFLDIDPRDFPFCVKATILSFLCKPRATLYHIVNNTKAHIDYGYSYALFDKFSPRMQTCVAGIFLSTYASEGKIPVVHKLCNFANDWVGDSIKEIFEFNKETHKLCSAKRYENDTQLFEINECYDENRVVVCPEPIQALIPTKIREFIKQYDLQYELVGRLHVNTNNWSLLICKRILTFDLLENNLSDFFNRTNYMPRVLDGKTLKAPTIVVRALFPRRNETYWTGRIKYERTWKHEFSVILQDGRRQLIWDTESVIRNEWVLWNWKTIDCPARVPHPLGQVVQLSELFQA